jgi:hypothetical protein
MTDNFENKLRMYCAVDSICENNTEIWHENEVFSGAFMRFRAKLPVIRQHLELIRIEEIFNASLKSVDRIELEETAFMLCGKLLQVARNTSNASMQAQVLGNREQLGSSSDIELINICNIVAHITSEYMNPLTESEVSRDQLGEFQRQISQFAFNANKAKTSQSLCQKNVEAVRKLFRDSDEILKTKLDTNIGFFKNSSPQFYEDFKLARESTAVNELM